MGLGLGLLEGLVMRWPAKPPWLWASMLRREVGRCSGHCCRAFTLHFSPETVENIRVALDAEERGESWPIGLPRPNGIDVVARMVRPVGPFHILTPAGDRFKGDDAHWYTCEHHDRESGNCMIYDRRPGMCRDYPYGRVCNYLDCTRSEVTEEYLWVGPPNVQEPVEEQEPGDADSGTIDTLHRSLLEVVAKPSLRARSGAERVLWAVVVAGFGEHCARLGMAGELSRVLAGLAGSDIKTADMVTIINDRLAALGLGEL